MRLLGSVQEIGLDGRLIVRGTFVPEYKDRAMDNRGRPIGVVRRCFGPVDSPYVIIQPTGRDSLLAMAGKQVYIEEVRRNAKGKRGDRRD